MPPSLPLHIRSPPDYTALLPSLVVGQVCFELLTTVCAVIAAEMLCIGMIDMTQVRWNKVVKAMGRQHASTIVLVYVRPRVDPDNELRLTRGAGG